MYFQNDKKTKPQNMIKHIHNYQLPQREFGQVNNPKQFM